MKISIIGYKESSVNIFASLAKELSKKISGLELEERFVPELEDIPEIALECTTESDFVVVFALSEEKELVEQIKEKLIDVELKTKVRILKEIRDDFAPYKRTKSESVDLDIKTDKELGELILSLEKEMLEAAENLEFERAALIRDKVKELKEGELLSELFNEK